MNVKRLAHHVFPALHELLINHLARKIIPCFNVDSLLHDSICSTSKGLASAVLPIREINVFSLLRSKMERPTWHGTVAGIVDSCRV